MSEEANALEDVNNDAHLEEGAEPEAEVLEDSQSESIQDDVQEVDYDSFAKVQGWAPKDKWRGDPDKWVTAETFVKRGQEFQSTLKKKSDNLERELREHKVASERQLKMFEKMSEKAKADALREIKEQQKEALENDNDKLYDELEDKKGKVHEDYKPAPVTQTEDPSIASFKAENQWYGVDPIMTDAANRYCQSMSAKGMSIAEQLTETQKFMVKRFPDDFENPRRQVATTVSKAPAPSRVKKTRSLSELPAAEQTMVKAAAKASGVSEKEYVKQYFEMENL